MIMSGINTNYCWSLILPLSPHSLLHSPPPILTILQWLLPFQIYTHKRVSNPSMISSLERPIFLGNSLFLSIYTFFCFFLFKILIFNCFYDLGYWNSIWGFWNLGINWQRMMSKCMELLLKSQVTLFPMLLVGTMLSLHILLQGMFSFLHFLFFNY